MFKSFRSGNEIANKGRPEGKGEKKVVKIQNAAGAFGPGGINSSAEVETG